MKRATREQIQTVDKMLIEGKSPVAVCAATGVSLKTAYNRQKKLREAGQLAQPKTKNTEEAAPQTLPVKTSLMTEADIERYGLPNKVDIKNVPKGFSLELGPLGISMADKVVGEILEPLKTIGIRDVYITVKAGGQNNG